MKNIVPQDNPNLNKKIHWDIQIQAAAFATKLGYLLTSQKKSCENEEMQHSDIMKTLSYFLTEIEHIQIKTGLCRYLIALMFIKESL